MLRLCKFRFDFFPRRKGNKIDLSFCAGEDWRGWCCGGEAFN